MVDAAAPPAGRLDQARADKPARDEAATFVVGGADALEIYVEAAADGLFSPAQSPIWVGAWIGEARPDVVIAAIRRNGRTILAIALEVVERAAVRTAQFMGGNHANGNFPPICRSDAGSTTVEDLRLLFAAIAKARPDIDLIALERLADEIGGARNPLLTLPFRQSPNLSLGVDLSGGFNAMLGRANAKRKRKKHRSQARKFETAGGFRRRQARTAAEVDDLLTAFFAMKAVRFASMGIMDVFAETHIRNFFRTIFTRSLASPEPPFVLHALEVGGKVRAVTGSSRSHDRLICEFGAIADDDMAFASPGEFLFFDNIEEACRDGYAVYDFSVGDEHYKRLWCDLEIAQFDVLMPLTAKGRAAAAGLRLAARFKSYVKNNGMLWSLVKKFRKRNAEAVGMAEG